MSSPPPGWRCPYCKDKKCRAYDRTEKTLGDWGDSPLCHWRGHAPDEAAGARRQAQKDQIRELQACKKRMAR